ncbi:hypothetical protein HID58_042400 [Brassica napus]|uniref:Strictosidine synthase conserved region domain-containing protein n=1 Tax=Brassica napus TaxID=3708 RepID=A0ABQ8BDJ6_BRANA|nr:hypothetical protein HID58_042400 [Brassica napus]
MFNIFHKTQSILIMPLFFSLRFLFFSAIIALLASIVLYRFDTFDPAPLPSDALVYSTDSIPPLINNQFLTGAEFIGAGLLNSPEDIAYHRDSGFIYTGCVDGWVKRVKAFESANDSVVEDWVNTGGRPLGLAFGLHGEVIVADAYKGLLNISDDGKKTELLTDEAEGVKFKLTDAVAVRDNGVLYFTDASYKYNLHHFAFDIWEGRPHGRLMSFDPITRTTRVLLRDRYFSNGVSMSPDQTHLVFCETPLRRCSKYYINEERVEVFIQSLPGYPDNIRCDGDGHYWIAMPSGVTTLWKLSFRYPFIRKLQALAAKYGFNTMIMENAGVLQVDLDGKPIALYHDPKHSHVTSGVKIGKYLYCGTSIALYRVDTFDPSHLPADALVYSTTSIPPLVNDQLLTGAEFIGVGLLNKPEDIAYDRDSGLIYTGCVDGWVKRVKVIESANDSVVEDWVNTGGRPLGLAFGLHGEVIVADAYKYDYSQSSFDFLEGKPHGRLMSFNPTTRTTRVLLKNLYFANGVSMSPDQTHLVFCETPVRRCSKYYISEERVEVFIENVLPGYPDNIRYDGDGHYWIAMPTGVTTLWKLSMRYPLLRKVTAMVAKWGFNLMFAEDAGVLQVDLDGNPIAFYHDQKITHLTTGVKIGKYLYCGSLLHSRILRLDLLKYLAQKSL